jgi:hypothetical protein
MKNLLVPNSWDRQDKSLPSALADYRYDAQVESLVAPVTMGVYAPPDLTPLTGASADGRLLATADNPIWGVDLAWCNVGVNYDVLADNGAKFAVVKAVQNETEDSMCRAHVQGSREAGMDIALYGWGDPINYARVQQQADAMRRMIDTLSVGNGVVCRVFSDKEQWWSSWAKYNLALALKIPWTDVPVLSLYRVLDFYADLSRRIGFDRQDDYSAYWFWNRYRTIPPFNWVASYFDYGKKPYPLTWEAFALQLRSLTKPTLPPNQTLYKLWQFSSRISLPGNARLDLNLFNGTEEEYRAYFGLSYEISLEEKVARLEEKVSRLEAAHQGL